MPLLYISVSLLAGLFAGSLTAIPPWLPILGLAGVIPSLLIPRYRKGIIMASVCFIALTGGMLRYQAGIRPLDCTQLRFFNGAGVIEAEGMISDAPARKGNATSFTFAADKITTTQRTVTVSGNALVRMPFYREFSYGDRLKLTGQLQTPVEFEDFDYPAYLANHDIYTVIYYPRIEILARDEGIAPLAWIYTLREQLSAGLASCLPEPQASLAQAILLGLRSNMPEDVMQAFYASGTVHLLAISGLNLTLILGMTLAATAWLFGRRYKIYIWASLALIWFYASLTGLPATVVRAAIMGSIFLLAELLGRQRSSLAALALAAAVMALISPRILWDTSFQLSFLSMLGLVYIAPYLINQEALNIGGQSRLVGRLKQAVIIGFGTALAAVLATWPVTALNFRTFSAASIPATFFAMPAMPPVIVTSALTALAAAWHPAGVVFGWIAWLFLSLFLLVIQAFSAIPFVYFSQLELQTWQATTYYVVLCLILLALHYRDNIMRYLREAATHASRATANMTSRLKKLNVWWTLALLALANILTWLAVISLPDGKLHLYVLDVGQGESILIRTPAGRNILVDTGPDPRAAASQLGKYLPFWDRQIDLLILSQPQADHNAGSIELLRSYNIRKIALPPLPSHSEFTRKLNEEMEAKGLAVLPIYEGKEIVLERGIKISVLNPPAGLLPGYTDDINNNTTVLRLEWNRISCLLTSDIEVEAERHLLNKRAAVRCDVLKVAHHGSRSSTSVEFLAAAHPSAAVISAGEGNRFGHPHNETLERLRAGVGASNLFSTMVNGTVEFITDGDKLWCRTERKAPAK